MKEIQLPIQIQPQPTQEEGSPQLAKKLYPEVNLNINYEGRPCILFLMTPKVTEEVSGYAMLPEIIALRAGMITGHNQDKEAVDLQAVRSHQNPITDAFRSVGYIRAEDLINSLNPEDLIGKLHSKIRPNPNKEEIRSLVACVFPADPLTRKKLLQKMDGFDLNLI